MPMLDVGLNPTRTTIGLPVEIPPSIPLAAMPVRFLLPFNRAAPNPSPISTPLTALIEIPVLAVAAAIAMMIDNVDARSGDYLVEAPHRPEHADFA